MRGPSVRGLAYMCARADEARGGRFIPSFFHGKCGGSFVHYHCIFAVLILRADILF